MTLHHLDLQDAAVLRTRHLLLTETGRRRFRRQRSDGRDRRAGRTRQDLRDRARDTRAHSEPVVSLAFEGRPTMRLIADRLLHAFTGMPARGTRFAMTDELLNRLAERRRLIVIGEAQNLDARTASSTCATCTTTPPPASRCSSTAATDAGSPRPRNRCCAHASHRRVAFSALTDTDVLQLIPAYHPMLPRRRARAADARQRQGRTPTPASSAAFRVPRRDPPPQRRDADRREGIARSAMTLLGGAG